MRAEDVRVLTRVKRAEGFEGGQGGLSAGDSLQIAGRRIGEQTYLRSAHLCYLVKLPVTPSHLLGRPLSSLGRPSDEFLAGADVVPAQPTSGRRGWAAHPEGRASSSERRDGRSRSHPEAYLSS